MRGLLITLSIGGRDCQPLDLAAGYLLKLRFPAFPWLGDKQQY